MRDRSQYKKEGICGWIRTSVSEGYIMQHKRIKECKKILWLHAVTPNDIISSLIYPIEISDSSQKRKEEIIINFNLYAV